MNTCKKMFQSTAIFVLLISLFVSGGLISSAHATGINLLTLANGTSASLVLGQVDFTSNGNNISPTQHGLYNPFGVTVDPTTGKVFVADTSHNRVLRFASVFALSNGADAEAVLGQSDFVSFSASSTANGMMSPISVIVDSFGRLWVADTSNNRILRFNSASTKANGASADAVLGQADFTSNTAATTQNGMNFPHGLALDSSGRLWVSDLNNSRVLRFDSAASKVNGANADGVLGQIDFVHAGSSAAAQNKIGAPGGMAVDSAETLWVADNGFSRILRYDNAADKANGANADGVLGQVDFTTQSTALSQGRLAYPNGLTMDTTGRLWVADFGNNRVLAFDHSSSLANGANASTVLGQPDFVTSTASTTASGMNGPVGVFYDPNADVLWTTEYTNNRALMFGTPTDTVAPVVTGFTATSPSTSLNIPITSFTATDAGGVAAYLITTSSTVPSSSNTNWSATLPTIYHVAAAGTYSLYPWVKDGAGNISAVFASPRSVTVTIPIERAKNGGFNTYTGISKIPTNWAATNFITTDGKNTTFKQEGTASVQIAGKAATTKTLKQTLTLSGSSGNKFTFSFYAKGAGIPVSAALCRGQVLFYNGITLLSAQTKTINCPTGTYTFQKKSLSFTVTASYTKVVIQFAYSKSSGTVWFDHVSLIK